MDSPTEHHVFISHARSDVSFVARRSLRREKPRGQKARRWVVERTYSWFNRFHGILTRWYKKAAKYQAMPCFVCGLTTYRVGFDRVFGNSVCAFPEMIIAKT